MNGIEFFNEVGRLNEFLEFGRVENPRSKYAALHGLLLLEELLPCEGKCSAIMKSVSGGMIYLKFSLAEIARLTEDQVLTLYRCGIALHPEYGLYL